MPGNPAVGRACPYVSGSTIRGWRTLCETGSRGRGRLGGLAANQRFSPGRARLKRHPRFTPYSGNQLPPHRHARTSFRMCLSQTPHGHLLTVISDIFSSEIVFNRCNKKSYLTQPIFCSGQTRSITRPTTCSWATQPTAVLRLSEEVARWSPITKILPSGT